MQYQVATAAAGGPLQALGRPGSYRFSVGGGQPGTSRAVTSNVLKGTVRF